MRRHTSYKWSMVCRRRNPSPFFTRGARSCNPDSLASGSLEVSRHYPFGRTSQGDTNKPLSEESVA